MRLEKLVPVGSLLLFLAAALPAAAGELGLDGHVALRAAGVRSQPSWLEGGFGRLRLGADGAGDEALQGLGELHLGLDWWVSERWGAYLHAAARAEPEELEGRVGGIVEAFLRFETPVREVDQLRLQLGHFLLPTSRENVGPLWASPYAITFSALNTWIGEEVRPTGLLAEYSLAVGAADELRLGASVFGGNDAMGALLAWRGFALGDRLTVHGETVPLPPIDSLAPGGAFAAQSARGTRPFGDDLDGRAGWAGYLRWQRPERWLLQYTRFDNPADRELHGGDYAWESDFHLFAAELSSRGVWTWAAEHLRGSTGMGERSTDHAQLDFETGYLLVSWRPGPFRATLRWERFEIRDVDLSGAEVNDEEGEAWTLALFWQPRPALRLGLELLDLDSERPAAGQSGFDSRADGRSLLLELRYRFGV